MPTAGSPAHVASHTSRVCHEFNLVLDTIGRSRIYLGNHSPTVNEEFTMAGHDGSPEAPIVRAGPSGPVARFLVAPGWIFVAG